MKEIYVVPEPGAVVRDPVTGALVRPDGEWKPDTQHWRRIARDGAATLHTQEPKSARKSAKSDQAKE